jgi:hypothetical protein
MDTGKLCWSGLQCDEVVLLRASYEDSQDRSVHSSLLLMSVCLRRRRPRYRDFFHPLKCIQGTRDLGVIEPH